MRWLVGLAVFAVLATPPIDLDGRLGAEEDDPEHAGSCLECDEVFPEETVAWGPPGSIRLSVDLLAPPPAPPPLCDVVPPVLPLAGDLAESPRVAQGPPVGQAQELNV